MMMMMMMATTTTMTLYDAGGERKLEEAEGPATPWGALPNESKTHHDGQGKAAVLSGSILRSLVLWPWASSWSADLLLRAMVAKPRFGRKRQERSTASAKPQEASSCTCAR